MQINEPEKGLWSRSQIENKHQNLILTELVAGTRKSWKPSFSYEGKDRANHFWLLFCPVLLAVSSLDTLLNMNLFKR